MIHHHTRVFGSSTEQLHLFHTNDACDEKVPNNRKVVHEKSGTGEPPCTAYGLT